MREEGGGEELGWWGWEWECMWIMRGGVGGQWRTEGGGEVEPSIEYREGRGESCGRVRWWVEKG